MTPAPADGDVESSEAFLSDLERIDASARGGDRHPARLREANCSVEPVLAVAQHKGDPIFATRLLIRGGGEDDVASESWDRILRRVQPCSPCTGTEESNHTDLDGERPLHINGATPPDVAVLDDAFKWVHRPAVLVGGDNVKVCKEEEGTVLFVTRIKFRIRRRGAPSQPDTDIASIREWLVELRLQAFALQQLNEHLRRARLVSRWIHTLGADQLHQVIRSLSANLLH